MDGFIKLPRSLLEWEWHSDPNTLSVYITLLLMAQFRDCRYKGVELKRGQLAITIPQIAEHCGLSIKQTRTALEHLKSAGKAAVKTTNKFSIITLIEYDCDFENGRQKDSQKADKGQSNGRPTLLQEEIKNLRNQENAQAHSCALMSVGETVNLAIQESFESFWNAYPKKTAKQNALKVWKKLKPDEELTNTILSALERHKQSAQWQKDNGQYIPYPATWLNGRRWEDDIQEVKQNGINSSDTRSERDWLRGFDS